MPDEHHWGPLSIPQRVHKLEVDMYYGDGKENPSMTTRVASLEDCVERMEKTSTETKKDNKATRRMMLGTLLTVVGSVIVAIICFKLGVKP